MSQDKIESRRAFMKKFGKIAGIATIAAPFVASETEVNAATDEELTRSYGCGGCSSGCASSCKVGCRGNCSWSSN